MAKTLLPEDISAGWEPSPNRKRFTRKECEFLEQNGLLTERYELIDGEIIFKMGQNPPHRLTVMLVSECLRLIFGGLYVAVQSSIDIAPADPTVNDPEPDIVVQAQSGTAFAERLPGPADILLIVEVSDTTARFDLRNKAVLYARAGVADYWVVDIVSRRVVVHRGPAAAGYGQVIEYGEAETVSPLARPDALIRVSDLLPPAQD